MMLLDRLMQAASRDLSTLPGRVHLFNVTAKHVARLANPEERELYMLQLSTTLGVRKDTVKHLFEKAAGG